MIKETVEVKTLMGQTYKGERVGSHTPLWMSPGDADDAVAVRMVVKTGRTRSATPAPPAGGAAGRSGTYTVRAPQDRLPEGSQTAADADPVTVGAPAKDTEVAKTEEEDKVSAHPQKPYPHRAMNPRR